MYVWGQRGKGTGVGTCMDVLVYGGVGVRRYVEDEEGGVGGGGARLLGAALTPPAGETSYSTCIDALCALENRRFGKKCRFSFFPFQ